MKEDIKIEHSNLFLSLQLIDSIDKQASVQFILNAKIKFLERDFIEINKSIWFDFDDWDTFLKNIKGEIVSKLSSSDESLVIEISKEDIYLSFSKVFLESECILNIRSTDLNFIYCVKNSFIKFPKWW
ncbi:MAG: hypothetical protein EAZ50_09365 [Runella slithyformis]|nr:MAG: hypothetical protein EAY79_05190 [Runella slithyformis]TAF80210.1 MAG: hypothetical protein EAZ50_09365 [Runella slithyformis]